MEANRNPKVDGEIGVPQAPTPVPALNIGPTSTLRPSKEPGKIALIGKYFKAAVLALAVISQAASCSPELSTSPLGGDGTPQAAEGSTDKGGHIRAILQMGKRKIAVFRTPGSTEQAAILKYKVDLERGGEKIMEGMEVEFNSSEGLVEIVFPFDLEQGDYVEILGDLEPGHHTVDDGQQEDPNIPEIPGSEG